MDRHPTRRAVLSGLSALALASGQPARAAIDELAALEARHGGRLGVFALDTGGRRTLAHRADERFLMCSTTKFALAAAVLARVDAGAEQLGRLVPYGTADVDVGHAPDTRAHLAEGHMSVEGLCRAAIEHSDNGAANLLFASLGGPAAVTRFVRGLGDDVSRFDRTELALNQPDGDADTTNARAFVGTMRAILLGTALSAASRGSLDRWMTDCTTGMQRIRAGVPRDWTVGDKTGTAGVQADDVAVLRPPGRAPLLVAAYCDAPSLKDEAREALLRQVGGIVARWSA